MDQTILQRIALGENSAVQECLDKYGGLVWSLARRMLRDNNEAEDAVQEIFIEIWKNAERFDETQSSETTFIAMIARRRLIDRIRKHTRTPNIDSFEDILVEPTGKTEEEVYVSIEAMQVAKLMKDLRPEQKKVLQLSIVDGYSHQEICDALDMPLGTVKTHARRGLIQVRELLESKGIDDLVDQIKEVSA
ncbi:MAG: RNA polymerase sigma factor [Pyrinomonadaceae bacterium]|nr:RNA polymerase sigma factor [Pyrinomonadaceae bacterium]